MSQKEPNTWRNAHNFSRNNKPGLEKDNKCVCFYCGAIYDPTEIEKWLISDEEPDRQGTALCPRCGIDAVIGECSGYPVKKEFLDEMHSIWFE